MNNQLFYIIATLASLRCIFACSNIFSYSNDYRSGTFMIDGVVDSTIETTIQLSVPDILSQSNVGSLRLQDYDVYQTLSTTGRLYYVALFPISQSVPRVTMITTNGRVICTGEPYYAHQLTKITLSHTYTSSLGHNSRFGSQRMPSEGFPFEDNDVFSMSDENTLMSPVDNQIFPSLRRNTSPQPTFGGFINIGDQTGRTNIGPPITQRRPQMDDSLRRDSTIQRRPQMDDSIRRDMTGFYTTIGSPPFSSFGNRDQLPSDDFPFDNRPHIQQSNRNVGTNWRSGPGSSFEPSLDDSSRQPSIGRPNSNEQSQVPQNRAVYRQPSQSTRGTDNRQPIAANVASQSRPPNRSEVGCGTVVHGLSSHIYFGESIQYGSWPWLVPIFQANSIDMKFLCGGTLVSSRAVITSAHCFNEANNLDGIFVVVGRFNLLEWTNRNTTIIKVNVTIHPHYRTNDANFDADIAVLYLEDEAILNDYVRPACVWERTIFINDIVNKTGVVAGWGLTEQGVYSTLPKQIMTPVVSNEECFNSNPALQSLTTGRNFCAGKLDGTGPCKGDSGGGLLFNVNGRWTLRGIVSAIINTRIEGCDLSNYVVYTDIAQFHDFLDPLI